MNHRYFSRTPIALKVKLANCEQEFGVFFTRDLNYDGVGIEGDFSQLNMTPCVRIKFIDYSLEVECEVQGLLVEHSDSSIGVMFNNRCQKNISHILNQFPGKKIAA